MRQPNRSVFVVSPSGAVFAACLMWSLTACTGDEPVSTNPCPGGICSAGDSDGGGLCGGVTCDQPPSQCRSAIGTCVSDVCTYAIDSTLSCDDGNSCTDADSCDAAGVCQGTPMVCDSPDAAACTDADTSKVYNSQGSCAAGICEYTFNEIDCPGACDSGSGLCPTPCAGITCDSPSSDCFETAGACVDGGCDYTVDTTITDCDDGDGCTNGDSCQGNGACVGVVESCDVPPASECLTDTRRSYTSIGATCSNDVCDFPFTDEVCGMGCTDGTCVGTCNESSCDSWTLPASANGTRVRSCTDSACSESETLPDLDENYFRCFVEPIFDTSCSMAGCHSGRTPLRAFRLYGRLATRWQATSDPTYQEGKHGDGPLRLSGTEKCTQTNTCDVDPLLPDEWSWNYDMARLFAASATSPAQSELVRQPLASNDGGLLHEGFDMFRSTADVRYQTLLNWLNDNGGAVDVDCNNVQMPPSGGSSSPGFIKDLNSYSQCGGGGSYP